MSNINDIYSILRPYQQKLVNIATIKLTPVFNRVMNYIKY